MKFSDFCAFKEGRGQLRRSGTPTADMNCGGKGGKPGPCPKKVSQTDSPEFKKWFKGSVVTYEDGTPMVMYHGTTADFESFRQHSLHSRGHFFTDDPRLAGTRHGSGLGGHIKPVYLSIKNPVPQKVRQNMYAEHGSLLIDELVKLGYDGIVYERNHLAIVFRPHQIKSAIGNRGTFDPRQSSIIEWEGR